MNNNLVYNLTTTIASGASLSAAVDLTNASKTAGLRLFGLDVPASWTTANITLQQKHADGVYRAVTKEDGTELAITVTAGAVVRFSDIAPFSALTDIKLLSGTTATPVNQGADRTIGIVVREV